MLTRRQMIHGALATGAISLGGCATFVSPITAFCPDDPRISDPNSLLTIDTHCHVFNGTDIPVERYITLVQGLTTPILKYLGELLQEVSWETAPTGAQEISVLRQINQLLSAGCRPGEFENVHVAHRNGQHRAGVIALNQALSNLESSRRPALRSTYGGNAVANAIRSLPTSYPAYRHWLSRRSLYNAGINSTIDAAVAFVVRQFQYRYVSVFDFLTQYASGSPRKIDLAVSHFLDFDWPLALGRRTLTSIADQIDVMEQISILTGGRVHSYVPFDPMKQVAFDLGYPTESPMLLVQKAITSQGFVGVKIYPPIGFAPACNASIALKSPGFWHRQWLPLELQRPDLGWRLDGALLQLYSWCIANAVPIMAHTSASEGPAKDFEALTAARYWRHVPSGLRVDFGHFGNTEISPVDKDLARARKYSALMGPQKAHGAHFYADAAYFTRAMTEPDSITEALQKLFLETPILKQRLMYGSDWEMLLIAGNDNASYLRNFEQIFSNLDKNVSSLAQDDLANRFFGVNAADYLSLRSGGATRSRLDAFYAQRGVRKPQWAQKVDKLPALMV